jgi:hypothetical protein
MGSLVLNKTKTGSFNWCSISRLLLFILLDERVSVGGDYLASVSVSNTNFKASSKKFASVIETDVYKHKLQSHEAYFKF